MSDERSVTRVIEIRARRATVFGFFTDTARWAAWWGPGSTIDPVIGGAVLIVYPTGDRASGVVRELIPDQQIAFTFGYEGVGKPIAPGGSLVTITLGDLPGGATRLELRHDLSDAKTRDEHVQGWRYQLARFSDVVSDAVHRAIEPAITAWFTAWNDPDPARRRELLAPVVAASIRFRDRHGDLYGLDELVGHIGAVHRFMPNVRLELRGSPRRSHDVALADWAIVRPDGSDAMTGTNVVRMSLDHQIEDVVGVPG